MATPITQTIQKQKIVKTFSDTTYFAKGSYKREFIQLFSTSVLANYLTKTILAPLERWRIIKQTQLAYQLRPNKIRSFSQYITKVSKEQGWSAFWRGNQANCWMHFWQVLSQVFLFDSIKASFHEYSFELRNNTFSQGLFDRIFAPTIAAAATLVVTHPIDTARIRISMNYYRNPKQMLFTGITSAWSLIRLEERSARGLYRGYPLALLIGVLHLNIYATFRNLWNSYNQQGENKQLFDLLLSKESIGSLLAILVLHPLDTIKKNLQLNNQSKPKMFDNSRQVINYYRTNLKIQHLYQGLSISLIRQGLFWPIFITSLNFLDKNVQIF